MGKSGAREVEEGERGVESEGKSKMRQSKFRVQRGARDESKSAKD